MKGRAVALATLLLLLASASRAESDRPRNPYVGIALSGSALLASFDGELQTPLGGRRGTTSPNRPNTGEVGLDGVAFHALADLELRFFEQHAIHFAYASLERNGKQTLKRSLTTHGQTFPNGARVDSRLEVPFGRIGYRARWLPFSWRGWTLAPEVGAARMDFRYLLQSKQASGKANREYVLYFAYWGGQIAGPLSGRLRGELDLFASAGLSNVASIDSDLRLVYPVVENRWLSASLVLGLRGIWIHYLDDQDEEQNDIDVRVGAYSGDPWAGAHLGIRLRY